MLHYLNDLPHYPLGLCSNLPNDHRPFDKELLTWLVEAIFRNLVLNSLFHGLKLGIFVGGCFGRKIESVFSPWLIPWLQNKMVAQTPVHMQLLDIFGLHHISWIYSSNSGLENEVMMQLGGSQLFPRCLSLIQRMNFNFCIRNSSAAPREKVANITHYMLEVPSF